MEKLLLIILLSSMTCANASGDPEKSQGEKRREIAVLFEKAVQAFQNRSYQMAINVAEHIRTIEFHGDTSYLNEAKQIIDSSRILQREDGDPFLNLAKDKFAKGDYRGSKELCVELAKQDIAYEQAKDCIARAEQKMNEATRGLSSKR